MQSATPFVSVIIPVYNDLEGLACCLEALEHQDYPRARFEILVADNASTHDVAGLVAKFDAVRLVREFEPGSYRARNRAAGLARGEVLAFTDADCRPRPEWLSAGVRALSELGPSAAVGGAVELFARSATRPTWVETYELALAFPQRRYVEQQHFAVTANLFVTRSVWQHVGPFNAILQTGGDKEWGQRAHGRGVRLAFAADAIVDHPARHDWPELAKKRARLVQGALSRNRAKYPNWLATLLVFGKACMPPVLRMLRRRPATGGLPGAVADNAKVLGVAVSLQAYSAYQVLRLARNQQTRG